jgi:phosphoribosylformylglycinamidine synthase subunit PurS
MHRSLSTESDLSSPTKRFSLDALGFCTASPRLGGMTDDRLQMTNLDLHEGSSRRFVICHLSFCRSHRAQGEAGRAIPLSNFFFTQPPSPLMVSAVKLEVVVMPKRNVLDPQGVAVRNAVRELGLSNVGTVRVGKIIEIEFTGEPDEAKLDEICRDLLCNEVIEDYRILGAVLK